MQKAKIRKNIGLVIIDYLQLIQGSGKEEQAESKKLPKLVDL